MGKAAGTMEGGGEGGQWLGYRILRVLLTVTAAATHREKSNGTTRCSQRKSCPRGQMYSVLVSIQTTEELQAVKHPCINARTRAVSVPYHCPSPPPKPPVIYRLHPYSTTQQARLTQRCPPSSLGAGSCLPLSLILDFLPSSSSSRPSLPHPRLPPFFLFFCVVLSSVAGSLFLSLLFV